MANVLADDLDQTVSTDDTPVLTWVFSFGSKGKQTAYEIDLTEANYSKLEEALRPFINAGRAAEATRTTAVRSAASKSSAIDTHGADTKEVRAWAIKARVKNDNGKVVAERGRISQSVYDAYRDRDEVKRSGALN